VIQIQSFPAIRRISQRRAASSIPSAAADDGFRAGVVQVAVEFFKGGLRLVGGEQRAAPAGETFGFAEMQVGDGEGFPGGPEEGAGGQQVERFAVEEERVVHGVLCA
jgi:hypothetical protein